MSTPVAVVGLTFDGVDVQNLNGLYLEIVGGLSDSPTVRGVDVTIPNLPGQVARPRRFHERRPLLAGWVRGSGGTQEQQRAAFRTEVRDMLALFDATAAPADLVAFLEDGDTATIPARTLQVATAPVIDGEYANVSIELLSTEDWVYETPGS